MGARGQGLNAIVNNDVAGNGCFMPVLFDKDNVLVIESHREKPIIALFLGSALDGRYGDNLRALAKGLVKGLRAFVAGDATEEPRTRHNASHGPMRGLWEALGKIPFCEVQVVEISVALCFQSGAQSPGEICDDTVDI
jgi:hypothetical protein